jgi:hypothetical protein
MIRFIESYDTHQTGQNANSRYKLPSQFRMLRLASLSDSQLWQLPGLCSPYAIRDLRFADR